MAYEIEMAERCSGCGTHPRDWQRSRNAYVAEAVYCEGCARLELEHENDVGKRKGIKFQLITLGESIRRMRSGKSVT